MASQQRLCHSSTHTPASHTSAQSFAHPSLLDVTRVQPQRQNPLNSVLSVVFLPSSTFLQEQRFIIRVVVNGPTVRQSAIHVAKVFPTPRESPNDIDAGYVVAALADAGSNPPQRQLGSAQPKIRDFDAITRLLPSLKSAYVAQPAESRLECEIDPVSSQPIQLAQQHSRGGDSRFQYRR